MNLGLYIDSLSEDSTTKEIYTSLNSAITDEKLRDANVFYNKINFNPQVAKFGIFNATEIWCFTGDLIATTLENVMFAKKIVNKFRLFYLFNKQDKDIMSLISLENSVGVLTRNQDESDYVFRVTGKRPKVLNSLSVEDIKGAIA